LNDLQQLLKAANLAQVKPQSLKPHANWVHVGVNKAGQNGATFSVPNIVFWSHQAALRRNIGNSVSI